MDGIKKILFELAEMPQVKSYENWSRIKDMLNAFMAIRQVFYIYL